MGVCKYVGLKLMSSGLLNRSFSVREVLSPPLGVRKVQISDVNHHSHKLRYILDYANLNEM
jgi:hypothetical protein